MFEESLTKRALPKFMALEGLTFPQNVTLVFEAQTPLYLSSCCHVGEPDVASYGEKCQYGHRIQSRVSLVLTTPHKK